jgi:antitoxin YefM
MEIINYTSLRENLKEVLDAVVSDDAHYIINRGKDSAVIMSLEEYNSWQETLYLMQSPKNAERLLKAVRRDQKGKFLIKSLVDEK